MSKVALSVTDLSTARPVEDLLLPMHVREPPPKEKKKRSRQVSMIQRRTHIRYFLRKFP